MKFKTSKGYNGNILLQETNLNNAINCLEHDELKVYLKLCILCLNKENKEINELAKITDLENNKLFSIIEKLDKKKFIKLSSSGITLEASPIEETIVHRIKTNLDNNFEMMSQQEISSVIRVAEKVFGKFLSPAEVNVLTNLKYWYGFSSDVILILIEYVSFSKKPSFNLIEKTALQWYELEIDTPKKAHEFIRIAEEKKTVYGKIKTLLKIYNRDLTKKEKEFVDSWKDKFSDEEIAEAYEKTVDFTGKISFAYMNKVLNSHEIPIYKNKKIKTKTTKFSNFEQRSENYKSIEQQMFEKMINEAKKDGQL